MAEGERLVYDAVCDHWLKKQESPTLADLVKATGLAQMTIQRRVRALIKAGHLVGGGLRHRSIKPVGMTVELPDDPD